ncbi:MAG: elongation factor EF-2 [Candidatus Diapherotrites archaeon]
MAKREDIVKLAETLMGNRENIRNIGIVAHIDHGKCVSGKTNIVLANGTTVKAKALFESAETNGRIAGKTGDEVVFDITGQGINAVSFNKQSKDMEFRTISHAWKLKATEPLIKLTLSNGQEISTTPEHKYLCAGDDGTVTEKQAKDVMEKDFILCPRHLPAETLELEQFKTEFLDALSKDPGFIVNLDERNALELKRAILSYGMEKLRKGISSPYKSKSFYHCVYNGRYRLNDFRKIAGILRFNAFEKIAKINYRKTLNQHDHSSVSLNLPKTESGIIELFYLLGLIWGDGGKCGKDIRITNEDRQIIESVKRVCREVLGTKAKERKYAGKATRIDLSAGITFTRILEQFFEFPLKNKSHSITIPKIIRKMPNHFLKAFIQGYFDADGGIEMSRRAASISSASKRMIEDLYSALLRFGCIATIYGKKNTLFVSSSNLKPFSEKVGFRLERKQISLEKILSLSDSPNRNTDLLPIKSILLKQTRKTLGIPLNKFAKTQEAIELGLQNIYLKNFLDYVKTIYSFIGNPKIKNQEAWDELQAIEKIFFNCFTARVEKKGTCIEEFVYDFTVEGNHNFVGNGALIHNTTLTDNLVAAAGLISKELAGKQQFMDYYELEQARGITINSANISLVHKVKGIEYLINIIDTPGHVDFGGEVIRAMRAVDGVMLVVDAVEGVMPQTETVVRQALKEKVKPMLFINTVDRLVNELQVTEKEMQERFVKTIAQVNNLIKKNVPEEFVDEWKVNAMNGSVGFGSAYNNWAVSVPQKEETGIGFKEVYEYCKQEKQKDLAKKSPLHETVIKMIVQHMPNPMVSQKYRIPKIWSGDMESEEGKSMGSCDPNGVFTMMVNDVSVDAHAGDIATGRIYSGTVKKGSKLRLIGSQKEVTIQSVAIYMGPERITVSEISAGNIGALVGTRDIYAGETISEKEIKEFESFFSTAEPVMTISVEAKSTKDLPKLIEVIRQITKEDPNIKASINQETGEHLLSGMGELHLEVTQYRIEVDHKIPITVSPPIVVYHEAINKSSPTLESKSPNRHNKLKMRVEPIPAETLNNLIESRLNVKIRPKDKDIVVKLQEIGFDNERAKKIWCVHNNNVLVDATRGIQALQEIKELVIQGFKDAMDAGPLAKEKSEGIQVILEDATLHEDAIHRGPAQLLPTTTRGIYACMLSADAVLHEPKQTLTINVPEDFMGSVSKELGSRRTQISEMRQEGDTSIIIGRAPVKELIGFSAAIRSATQGRAIWTAEYAGYELLPRELQEKVIKEVRTRKGMDPQVKPAAFFLE